MSKSQYGTKSFRCLSREFQISKIVVLYICFSAFYYEIINRKPKEI